MTSPSVRLTSALANRYRLGRELGQGGMATVYLAEDLLRSVDQLASVRKVRGTSPFFSPDGLWLGYTDGAMVLKLSLAGGAPVQICDSCPGYAFQWGSDDTVRFHRAPPDNLNSRVLMAVSARGGRPYEVARPDSGSGEAFRIPILLPGTRTVVFAVYTGNSSRLAALDLATGAVTRFDQSGFTPKWVEAGFIALGTADGGLIALPFDKRRAKPTGPRSPSPVMSPSRTGSHPTRRWPGAVARRDHNHGEPAASAHPAAPRLGDGGRHRLLRDAVRGGRVAARPHRAREAVASPTPCGLVSFPSGDTRRQVSAGGGRMRRWSRTSGELFYWQDSTLMAVLVSTAGAFRREAPTPLFTMADADPAYGRWDVSADGRWFLIAGRNPDAPAREIHLVLNWNASLRTPVRE